MSRPTPGAGGKAEEPGRLTDHAYWDRDWSDYSLPQEVRRNRSGVQSDGILDVFDRFLAPDENKSILEIGGALGQWLACLARAYRFQAHALDFSPVGCEKLRKNFQLLGIPVTVYESDLFADLSRLPEFDIVYSLGLVEHFADPFRVAEKHFALLKPGGLLFLGFPVFGPVYGPVLRRWAPTARRGKNLESMVLSYWKNLERTLPLEVLFRDYVGGFDPVILDTRLRVEYRQSGRSPAPPERALLFAVKLFFLARINLYRALPALRALNKINSRFWSNYALLVGRKK